MLLRIAPRRSRAAVSNAVPAEQRQNSGQGAAEPGNAPFFTSLRHFFDSFLFYTTSISARAMQQCVQRQPGQCNQNSASGPSLRRLAAVRSVRHHPRHPRFHSQSAFCVRTASGLAMGEMCGSTVDSSAAAVFVSVSVSMGAAAVVGSSFFSFFDFFFVSDMARSCESVLRLSCDDECDGERVRWVE